MFSYSRVGCYGNCPYQYKLRYVDKLKTIPECNADNALYLGLGLHTGIELGVEAGLAEYKSHYNIITDAHINWMMQLEYQIPRVIELLPEGGEHELEIKTDNFVGYIDYVHGDTLYDFKFSNNIDNYTKSPQLSIYKYYLELVRPDIKINHLKYVFVPKINIRQKLKSKPPETIVEFRNRLQEQLDASEIKIIEVEYDSNSVTHFQQCCQHLMTVNDFPRNPTKLCNWCSYQSYCESDGSEDWMILNDKEGGISMATLPKNERRTAEAPTKRTMWLYGSPFSGKTTFADSAPDPLMLNTDGNAVYVTAPYVSIQDEVTVNGRITQRKMAWQVFKEFIDELEKGQNDFKTIVVDLVNDTYEMCRLYMFDKLGITHESDDSFKAWDKTRTEYLSTMRRVLHLPYENIILLSHEDSTKDLTKKSADKLTNIRPKMPDKVADSLAGMVAFVGRVYVDEGKHLLSIKSDEVIYGGGRLGVSDVVLPLDWNEVVKLFEKKEVK